MGGGDGTVEERKVKVAEVALRCLLCGLGALAAALVATDAQTRTFFGLRKTATFTDMRALVFLVAADAVAAGYSLLQAARCLLVAFAAESACRGSGSALVRPNRRAAAWCVFSCDQVLAYVTLAAAAAALQASALSERGAPAFQWMGVCRIYGAFCRRAGAGVASGLAAALAATLLASLSAFNLFRLYGNNKSSGSGGGATTTTW